MNWHLQAMRMEVRNGVTFCMFCKGMLKSKCIMCKQPNSKIRKEFPVLVDYFKEIEFTKFKMKKYQLPTTGILCIDVDCKPIPQAKPTAVITKQADGMWYAYLFHNNAIRVSANCHIDAKRYLAIRANEWQPNTFSPNWRDYSWKEEYDPDYAKKII